MTCIIIKFISHVSSYILLAITSVISITKGQIGREVYASIVNQFLGHYYSTAVPRKVGVFLQWSPSYKATVGEMEVIRERYIKHIYTWCVAPYKRDGLS